MVIHWIIGRGHIRDDLLMLNHWLGVTNETITNPGSAHGLSHS